MSTSIHSDHNRTIELSKKFIISMGRPLRLIQIDTYLRHLYHHIEEDSPLYNRLNHYRALSSIIARELQYPNPRLIRISKGLYDINPNYIA